MENGRAASHVIRVDPEWLCLQFARLDEQAGEGYGADLLSENDVVEFMILLNKAVLDSDNDVVPKTKIVSPLVSSVMDHVGSNLEADLSLDALAETFFVSKYYLSRQFKKGTGLNLHEYVLKKRLLRSKDLLSIRGSAQSVYRMCGFTSYTHFLRCFKQEFNMTTKEFIRRNKNSENIYFSN